MSMIIDIHWVWLPEWMDLNVEPLDSNIDMNLNPNPTIPRILVWVRFED
jgi:hypothetical protein